MPLFEVAILEMPTNEAAEKGDLEVLFFGPKPVVAATDKAASIVVLTKMAPLEGRDPNRLVVLVRPFG